MNVVKLEEVEEMGMCMHSIHFFHFFQFIYSFRPLMTFRDDFELGVGLCGGLTLGLLLRSGTASITGG